MQSFTSGQKLSILFSWRSKLNKNYKVINNSTFTSRELSRILGYDPNYFTICPLRKEAEESKVFVPLEKSSEPKKYKYNRENLDKMILANECMNQAVDFLFEKNKILFKLR